MYVFYAIICILFVLLFNVLMMVARSDRNMSVNNI